MPIRLDLIVFPTIIWYEADYSVYTIRKASRRSWRIGPTRPTQEADVRVFFAFQEGVVFPGASICGAFLRSGPCTRVLRR